LKSVKVPSNVTSLDTTCFKGCNKLTSATIQAKISSIERDLFDGCDNLQSVTLSSSIKSIGQYAIAFHSSLSKISSWSKVKTIGNYAFSGTDLSSASIQIPASVQSIGEYAFSNSGLTSVTVPSSVTSLGANCFSNCNKLSTATIEARISSIERDLFNGCNNLESVTLSDSVTSIGANAFANLSKLSSVSSWSNVTTIGNCAFSATSFATVTLSSNIQSIGTSPFSKCPSLVWIDVDESNTMYKSIDGVLFDNDEMNLIQYPCGRNEDYTVPDNVTAISAGAFNGCKQLQSIIISDSVKTIGNSAFEDCSSLTSLTIPSSVTSIGNYAFMKCRNLDTVNTLGMTAPQCPTDSFNDCSARACAFATYKSTSFCGNPLDVNSSAFDSVRLQHNKCYEVFVCSDSTSIVQKRSNASEWETQTDGCIEYYCDNESGNLLRYTCVSDDEYNRACVDGKCEETAIMREDAWSVEIDLPNGTNILDLDTNELLMNISNATGVDVDELRIGTEVNSEGQIVRLIIYLPDEDTAQSIVKMVEDCSSPTDSNNAKRSGGLCEGILGQTQGVKVVPRSLLSEGNRNLNMKKETLMLITSFVLCIGIVFYQ